MFCARSRLKKRTQKPTTKNFVGFHNHSPLLTMVYSLLFRSWFGLRLGGIYSMLTSHIVSLYIFHYMVFLPMEICIGRLYEKLTWSICIRLSFLCIIGFSSQQLSYPCSPALSQLYFVPLTLIVDELLKGKLIKISSQHPRVNLIYFLFIYLFFVLFGCKVYVV